MTVVTLLLAILLLAGVSIAIALAAAACILGLARLERATLVPVRVRDRRRPER